MSVTQAIAISSWFQHSKSFLLDVTLPHCPHSILTLSDYVTELGHPYVWVQKLGGLHFPKEQPQAWHKPLPSPPNIGLSFGVLSCPPAGTSCPQTMAGTG